MAESTRAKLARLEARLAAQEAELAAYRAERAAARRRPRRRGHVRAALAAALLVALVPFGLLAAHPFTDLDPASPHNGDIDAIYNAGITKGCNPPDFTEYCPTRNVTREEMASFLARTAGLNGNPPVVNALTATQADSATNATNAQTANTATTATNAQQLGGQPPSAYLRVGDLTMRYTAATLYASSASIVISPENVYTKVERTAAGTGTVYLPLDSPTGIGQIPYRFKSATICYNTPGGSDARITGTAITARSETGGIFGIYSDNTARPGTPAFPNFDCYTVEDDSPGNTPGASYLTLSLNFPNATDDFLIGQIKVVLVPQVGGTP